jgi:hypothetical protein
LSAGFEVDDDLCLIPPLDQEGLASTPAQPHSQHHPLGSPQDQVDQQNNNDGTGGASDEPPPHSISAVRRERRREKSTSVTAPTSPRPRRPSTEPEHDRGRPSCGRSEELGRGLPLRTQERGKGAQEQERQQEVAELMREPEERGEKRRQPDETGIGSDIQHSEASDCSHNIGDEDDEDPRHAKRRRLPSTDYALTLPGEPVPVATMTAIFREPLEVPLL